MAKDKSGAAFPKQAYIAGPDGTGDQVVVYESDGLTERQWFAGQALNGDELKLLRRQFEVKFPEKEVYSLQELRYFYADTMLEAGK